MSKLIRINDVASKNLEDLVKITGRSRQVLLQKALEDYLKREFILKANEEMASYKHSDPKGWKEMMDEFEEWDITLLDGLEDE